MKIKEQETHKLIHFEKPFSSLSVLISSLYVSYNQSYYNFKISIKIRLH